MAEYNIDQKIRNLENEIIIKKNGVASLARYLAEMEQKFGKSYGIKKTRLKLTKAMNSLEDTKKVLETLKQNKQRHEGELEI
jgi:hypothetical protein